MTEEFKLTPEELGSPIWAGLERKLQAELVRLRAKNDAELNAEQTARLRGEIACVKKLIALGKPPLQSLD